MKQKKIILLAAAQVLLGLIPLVAQSNMILVKGGTFKMGNPSEGEVYVL